MVSPIHQTILGELEDATEYLISHGLADDYVMAFLHKTGNGCYNIRYSSLDGPFSVTSNVEYSELYRTQYQARQYNFRMLDGALIQMWYSFDPMGLLRHRLAFLPAPDLLEFQNNSDVYSEELLYADVVDRRVVTVPLRFDFDRREETSKVLAHPISHLTLGNYSRCRIPVSAGVTPNAFVDFILRNFYGTASESLVDSLPTAAVRFDDCIADAERQVIHIGLPTHV